MLTYLQKESTDLVRYSFDYKRRKHLSRSQRRERVVVKVILTEVMLIKLIFKPRADYGLT